VKFFRALGRAIDWIGIRLILLLFMSVVGYAVLQPLIWSQILHRPPPANSSDLASLMAIVVTIMSVALAGFGVVVYQLAERRSEAGLNRRAKELQDDLRVDAAIANAKLYLNISVQAFLSYEDLWREEGYSGASLKNNRQVKDFLGAAIGNSENARKEMASLSAELLRRPKCVQGLLICKGNLAYFLATRASPEDKNRVLDLAHDVDQPGINIQKQDTVAWAYLRYSQPGQRRWKTGLSVLAALMNREDMEPDHADVLRSRYRGVFSNKEVLPAGLEQALAGVAPS
jgi:hypothetical protein